MDSNSLFFVIFPLLFITVGGLFLSLGIFFIGRLKFERQQLSQTVIVPGTIVDYKERWAHDKDGHSYKMYTPVIQYEWNRFFQEHISSVSYGKKENAVGSKIDVHVMPNGKVVDADSIKIFKILGIVFTLIGSIALIVGIVAGLLIFIIKR